MTHPRRRWQPSSAVHRPHAPRARRRRNGRPSNRPGHPRSISAHEFVGCFSARSRVRCAVKAPRGVERQLRTRPCRSLVASPCSISARPLRLICESSTPSCCVISALVMPGLASIMLSMRAATVWGSSASAICVCLARSRQARAVSARAVIMPSSRTVSGAEAQDSRTWADRSVSSPVCRLCASASRLASTSQRLTAAAHRSAEPGSAVKRFASSTTWSRTDAHALRSRSRPDCPLLVVGGACAGGPSCGSALSSVDPLRVSGFIQPSCPSVK